jgi:hypothetical protein
MVPLIGSVVPVPPYPVDIFPYIFVAYMIGGSAWLLATNRRRPGVLADIEADLELTTQHASPILPIPVEVEPEPVQPGVPVRRPQPVSAEPREPVWVEQSQPVASMMQSADPLWPTGE